MELDHKKVEELATLRLTDFTEFLFLFYTKLVKKSRKTICQVRNFYKNYKNPQYFLFISYSRIRDFFIWGQNLGQKSGGYGIWQDVAKIYEREQTDDGKDDILPHILIREKPVTVLFTEEHMQKPKKN